jgi:hypothetical protein
MQVNQTTPGGRPAGWSLDSRTLYLLLDTDGWALPLGSDRRWERPARRAAISRAPLPRLQREHLRDDLRQRDQRRRISVRRRSANRRYLDAPSLRAARLRLAGAAPRESPGPVAAASSCSAGMAALRAGRGLALPRERSEAEAPRPSATMRRHIQMALSTGSRIGSYEIVGALGAGGMARSIAPVMAVCSATSRSRSSRRRSPQIPIG